MEPSTYQTQKKPLASTNTSDSSKDSAVKEVSLDEMLSYARKRKLKVVAVKAIPRR